MPRVSRLVPTLRIMETPARFLADSIEARLVRRFLPAWEPRLKYLETHLFGPRLKYLETHLVDHCNLNCRGCGHLSPLSEAWFADLETFRRDLRRLRSLFVSVEKLRLMGGEPLLHPELSTFLSIARDALPETRISVVTNGILLPKISDAFWKCCAANRVVLEVTRYPINLDVNCIRSKSAEYGVELVVTDTIVEFFKFRLRTDGTSETARTFACCKHSCSFLREGRIYSCVLPAMAHIPARSFGIELPTCDADSIDIHGNITGYTVLEYLSKPIPWCRFCTPELTDWPKVKWGLSKRIQEEWF